MSDTDNSKKKLRVELTLSQWNAMQYLVGIGRGALEASKGQMTELHRLNSLKIAAAATVGVSEMQRQIKERLEAEERRQKN